MNPLIPFKVISVIALMLIISPLRANTVSGRFVRNETGISSKIRGLPSAANRGFTTGC